MRAALDKHLPAGCRLNVPAGGMFFWVELPQGLDAVALLPRRWTPAWPYVPGAPFYCHAPRMNTLRLSFVTVAPPLIEQGVAALGRVLARRAGGPAMKRRFDQLDVFTAEALRGNPLAVVHDAQGLDDARMAAFARWTNLSETTFLLPPTDAQADYRVRIFTPGGELPFAGHPTLGSCHAWLAAGGRPRQDGVVVQQCGVGLVRVRRDGGRLAFAAPALRREQRAARRCWRRSARRWAWTRRACVPAPA